MGLVSESIYSGQSVVVPLADVQHIELHKTGIYVITKHTRWDQDGGMWANGIWINEPEAGAFRKVWCTYRSELEAETLADLTAHDVTLKETGEKRTIIVRATSS